MRKYLFFLFFSCFVTVVNAQDYIPYFHKITDVENQIRSYKFSSALKTYDSLFKIYPNISYKDIHNACICAIKTKDFNSAFKYAKQLVLKGYELKYFEKPIFADLRKRTRKWNSFVKGYDRLKNERQSKLNKTERNYYYQKHIEDQKAASSFNIPVQDSGFFKLAYELSYHIKKNDFPNLFLSKDTLSHKVHVMFRHYYGLFNRIKNDQELQNDPSYSCRSTNPLKTIIENALIGGLITPSIFENIVSYNDGNPFGELAVKIDIDNKKVYPILQVKPEDLNEMNSKRYSIGLGPIDDNSSSYLKGSWYSYYPFEEVKYAVENCDTCTSILDYSSVINKIEHEFSDKYEKVGKLEGFLLIDYINGNTKYCKYKFMRDLVKNGINIK
jgi:hypothetical protein